MTRLMSTTYKSIKAGDSPPYWPRYFKVIKAIAIGASMSGRQVCQQCLCRTKKSPTTAFPVSILHTVIDQNHTPF
jgi:hypothetical protein